MSNLIELSQEMRDLINSRVDARIDALVEDRFRNIEKRVAFLEHKAADLEYYAQVGIGYWPEKKKEKK